MNKVVSVGIVFENTEVMVIDAKYFGYFNIDNISRSVRRIALNSIGQLTYAKEVSIEIYSEANDTYYPFGDEDCATTIFERILDYGDIVSFILKYDDESEDEFFVDYDEGEYGGYLGARNVNQHCMLSDPGNLYIVIGKGMALYNCFDAEEINNEKLVRFRKRSHGITVNRQ